MSRLLAVGIALLIAPLASYAFDYHVNYTSGIDGPTRSGASTQPFKNLSYAVGRAAANDTIILSAGTHILGSSSTVGTVSINKKLNIRGNGASGSARTTLTGAWTDVVDFQYDYLNPLLSLTTSADGTLIERIEFVGGSSWDTRRIGSGVRMDSTSLVDIVDCNFLRIAGPAIDFWDGRDLEIKRCNFTDCGYEKNVAATGANGGNVGGMIRGVTVINCLFDQLSFTHSTQTLGSGGYGMKMAGEMTDNTYSRITTNLKPTSAWQNSPGSGRAPSFSIETQPYTYSGGNFAPLRNNIITDSNFYNPLSLGPDGYYGSPNATEMTFTVRNSIFNSPIEYAVEALTANMVFQNNYSKRNTFIYNSGGAAPRMTVRYNIAENLRTAFVLIKGSSGGLVVHNNSAHFNNQTEYNSPFAVINPSFLYLNNNVSDAYRGFYNNFIVSESTSTSEKFIRLATTTITDYNNMFIRNNHVHDFPLPSSSTVPGLGNVTGELANNTSTTTSGSFTWKGNLITGGTLGTTDKMTFWEPRSGATQLVNKGIYSIPLNTAGAQGQTGGTFYDPPTSYYNGTPDIGRVEYRP